MRMTFDDFANDLHLDQGDAVHLGLTEIEHQLALTEVKVG